MMNAERYEAELAAGRERLAGLMAELDRSDAETAAVEVEVIGFDPYGDVPADASPAAFAASGDMPFSITGHRGRTITIYPGRAATLTNAGEIETARRYLGTGGHLVEVPPDWVPDRKPSLLERLGLRKPPRYPV